MIASDPRNMSALQKKIWYTFVAFFGDILVAHLPCSSPHFFTLAYMMVVLGLF